jgi:hypothetical protein
MPDGHARSDGWAVGNGRPPDRAERRAAEPATADQSDDLSPLRQQVEQLVGICMVLNARVTELEHSNQVMRALLKLDAPKPTETAGWLMVKQVKDRTGLSESAIRNWINDHGKRGTKGEKVVSKRFGGRVWIKADTLPPGVKKRSTRSLRAPLGITK